MNEEEFKECSVVAYPHEIRFLHIKGGRISYYVDRHVSDYVNKLQQENQQLKSQYCERTDCSGRIGNSKKIEQLETEKEQLTSLVNSCQEEIRRLKLQLQQRDNIINKAREYINEYEKNRNCFKWNEQDYIDTINEIKEILNIDKGDE